MGNSTSPVTIHIDQATITSSEFTVTVPDAAITIDPTATQATTAAA